MARSTDKRVFTTPAWIQAAKCWFIDYGFRHNPDALGRLATEVRTGEITPREWATRYGLSETWVEGWAKEVIATWEMEPYLIGDLDRPNGNRPNILYPQPRDARKPADVFNFSVSTMPTSTLSAGILAGGSRENPGDDGRRFKKQMRDILERALEQYEKHVLTSGASREIVVPRAPYLKIETAALYFFCEMSPQTLLQNLIMRVGAETTVYRWIKEITKLLDLPMKRRGRHSASGTCKGTSV